MEDKKKKLIILWIIALFIALVIGISAYNLSRVESPASVTLPPSARESRLPRTKSQPPRIEIKPLQPLVAVPTKTSLPKKPSSQNLPNEELKKRLSGEKEIAF